MPAQRPGRLDHLEVVGRALLEPLRFEQPAVAVQFVEPDLQVALDLLDRLQQRRARRHVMAVGVDLDRLQRGGLLAGQRIDLVDRLDLVAEQRDAPGAVLVMRRKQLDRVAAHPEAAAEEIVVVAAVLQLDEFRQQLGAVDPAADLPATRSSANRSRPSRCRRCTRRWRRRRHRGVRGSRGSPNGASGRSARSATIPSRHRCRCAERRPRAGSSRNTRRNIRPRSPGKSSSSRRRAAPPASCSAPG